MQKLKVFVVHSFDKNVPEGKTKNDVDVANWFIKIMKNKPLNFEIITGSKPSPGERIDERIETDIAESDCVVAIFTPRYHDEHLEKYIPSSFTLCECACAIGLYYNTRKIICGFYEEGIDHNDLALLTVGGLEFIQFNREKLNENKAKFIEYLEKIPKIITSGGYREGQLKVDPPTYNQLHLRKIYTVYRNGNVIVQNITIMYVSDAERFNTEEKGQIRHEIWLYKTKLPAFAEMIKTSIEERKDKAFLQGIFRCSGQKIINAPLLFNLKKEAGDRTLFYVGFQDKSGDPLTIKDHDKILYQYAWGVLNAYARFEEDLSQSLKNPDGEINEEAYNQAEVVSNHGMIPELEIELRFEKGKEPIFSTSPFWQYAPLHRDWQKWTIPEPVPLIKQKVEEEDHAMWFQTYKLKKQKFEGRIRIMWRPSSKKHFET